MKEVMAFCMIVYFLGSVCLSMVVQGIVRTKLNKYISKNHPEIAGEFTLRGHLATSYFKYVGALYRKRNNIRDQELGRLLKNAKNIHILTWSWIVIGFFALCLLAFCMQVIKGFGI